MENDRTEELKQEGKDDPKLEAEDNQKQNVERKQTGKPRSSQSSEMKSDMTQNDSEEKTLGSNAKQTQKKQVRKKPAAKSKNVQKAEGKKERAHDAGIDNQLESPDIKSNQKADDMQKGIDDVEWEVEVNHEQAVGKLKSEDSDAEQNHEVEDKSVMDSDCQQNDDIDVHIDHAEDDEDSSSPANSEKEVFDRQNSIPQDDLKTQKADDNSDQEDEIQQDTVAVSDADDETDIEIDSDDGDSPDAVQDAAETLQDAMLDSDTVAHDNSIEPETAAVADNSNINDNSRDVSVAHTVRKIYIELNRAFVLSLAGIILLTYLITATVFSCLRYTPKTAVDQYIADLEYSVERNFEEDDEDENLKEFLSLIYNSDGEVQYRTKAAVKDGDNATVDVVFTFKDNSAVLDASLNNIMEADGYDSISEDDFYKQLIENFEIFTDYEDTYSKETVTFSLVKRGKCWVVDDDNLDFVPLYNIYFSNTFDMFLQMSE